jgi:hypothetical protein
MLVIFGKPMSGRTTWIKENYVDKFTIVFTGCKFEQIDYGKIVHPMLIHQTLNKDFIDRFLIRHMVLEERASYWNTLLNKNVKTSQDTNSTTNKIHDRQPTIVIDDLPIDDSIIKYIKILLKLNTKVVLTTIDNNIFNYFSKNDCKIIHSASDFIVYSLELKLDQ